MEKYKLKAPELQIRNFIFFEKPCLPPGPQRGMDPRPIRSFFRKKTVFPMKISESDANSAFSWCIYL